METDQQDSQQQPIQLSIVLQNEPVPNEEEKDENLEVLLIEDTIITQDYAEKVLPRDYKYYALPNDLGYNSIICRFKPDEDDVFLFKGTKNQMRLIYPYEHGYSDEEETQIKEFVQYCQDNNNEAHKHFDKRDLMRIMHSADYNNKKAEEELNLHYNWKLETLPIVLNNVMKDLLDSGLYYVHGRDRSLRPLNIFSPAVVLEKQFDINDAIAASHFVDQYIINYLMTPEKVENWSSILDLGKLSFNSLPKKWILDFIKAFSHHYYSRARCNYMLNSSFAVRAIWNIVKAFVDPVTKSKMVIEGSHTNKLLLERVHTKQLQEKFGGEAPNVTVFWPPFSPSDEFGVDPAKLIDISENIDFKNEDSKIIELLEKQKSTEQISSNEIENKIEAVETEVVFESEITPVSNQMRESPIRRSVRSIREDKIISSMDGPVSEKKHLRLKKRNKFTKNSISREDNNKNCCCIIY